MKIKSLIISLFMCLFLLGCGDGPEDTVKDFYKALSKNDTELLKKTTTPQGFTVISFAMGMMPATELAKLQNGIEIIKVEKESDTVARVQSKTKGSEKIHTDTVVKLNGEWKVDVKK